MHDLAFTAAGLAVGLIVGLTGVGGGSLMTPLLIFGFGVHPHLAIGTDLLFAGFTKLGGSIALARARRIDWPVVARLSMGSVPAALLTLAVLNRLGPATQALQQVMTGTLGAALLLTAAATFYKVLAGARPMPVSVARSVHPSAAIGFGALLGVLVTLTSVGAGAIGVLVLLLLYPALPLPRIVAADIAHAVPLTLIAGLGHASIGSVDWSLLALLLTGSLPGIWLGSKLLHAVPERAVRSLLSVLLGYAGLKLIAL